jgi:surfeit locus 1 family protein
LLHLTVLLAVISFVSLGLWQLRRLEARRNANARIEAQLALAPVAYHTLLAEFGPDGDPDYRRVVVTGRYDPERELLLRSRSFQGEPGWHLLTPLLLDGERALLIDRGWLPLGFDAPPIAEAAPPAGAVTLEGRLFAEHDPPSGPVVPRDPPEGALTIACYIDTDRLAAQLPWALEPYYLELERQTPSQTGELPVLPEVPQLSEGSHLGYALQWFAFALISLVGYGALLRSSGRDEGESIGVR